MTRATFAGRRARTTLGLVMVIGVTLGVLDRSGHLPRGVLSASAHPAAVAASAARVEAAIATTQRLQERTFWSTALRREMPYTVYLPAGYDANDVGRYPVLYMLHGLGGDHIIEWRAFGIVEQAERLTSSGAIKPMIIALPEGEDGYWVDHADGGPAWGTYVAEDFVSEIDSHFRTIATAPGRAIGGNSMGGHGAAQLALNFPGRFGVVGLHSPVLRTREEAPAYFGDEAYFKAHDPASLMQQHTDAARLLRIWMDVGDRDGWQPSVNTLHQELLDLGIPHEFHVGVGPHDHEYWIDELPTYLQFYSRALLHQPSRG